ncbi:MAG TPA: hypothetical protein VFD01_08555 [Candidatus Dormibacteraeota bacterium]|jgi:hypothetical protein|nr:hypothetical protein [Candidatus Dormibacteraeota bacterium]
MFALSVLIPTMAVSAIAWGVVGVFQWRGRQALTLVRRPPSPPTSC